MRPKVKITNEYVVLRISIQRGISTVVFLEAFLQMNFCLRVAIRNPGALSTPASNHIASISSHIIDLTAFVKCTKDFRMAKYLSIATTLKLSHGE